MMQILAYNFQNKFIILLSPYNFLFGVVTAGRIAVISEQEMKGLWPSFLNAELHVSGSSYSWSSAGQRFESKLQAE